MKKLILISAIAILAFSCKKNDYFIEKVDQNEGDDIVFVPYFFQGTLNDTTSGNSLIGYTLNSKYFHSQNVNYIDTITDSTYFFYFIGYGTLDSTINKEKMQVYIRNTSNVLVDSFAIPVSYWIANDTATYDYSF